MTEAEVTELISAQMATQWPVVAPTIPLVLENEALPGVDSFVLLTIVPTVSVPYTMGPKGTRREECRGNIFVKIWVPAGVNGTKDFAALADKVRAIFAGELLGTSGDQVTVSTGRTQRAGPDGRWYLGAVIFPYVYRATY